VEVVHPASSLEAFQLKMEGKKEEQTFHTAADYEYPFSALTPLAV